MFGGLAQLVERLLCKQDVSGSSPLTSTATLNSCCTKCGRRDEHGGSTSEGDQTQVGSRVMSELTS